ncbi:hypothetical protein ASE22_17955 [Sphingomonas sp. Root720]|nr:hypothetical protein ASE22_17955 [Sphingomonas sp. Root720]
MTEMENMVRRHPMETYRAWRLAEDSKAAVEERFPREERWNGPGDAYRHLRWNFAMTQSIGKEAAEAYADSHEADGGQPANEREMDLRNNRLGRAMAVDPRFQSLMPDAAAELALRKGWLHGLQR